ncbi:MAG: hypothetical protein ACE5JJ_07960 [Nitrospinota bacterium]
MSFRRCGHCGYRGPESDFLDDRCPARRDRVYAGTVGWSTPAIVVGGLALLLAFLSARP